MKLERYKDKKETRKKVLLIGLTVITLVSITMMLYKTFAKFTTTTSFTIMSGKVKYKPKGKDLAEVEPPTTSGDGLYSVSHSGADGGWAQTELRYAGSNPKNYVYFNCDNGKEENSTNCELWRIIGKVNVKTNSGVEQRLKIIRNDSLGNYAWDKNSEYTNDWTKSALKDMLNEGYYYQRTNVTCYTGKPASSSSKTTCNFNGGINIKGLTSLARDMIDNQVIWNLGGWNDSSVTVDAMYAYERGTAKYGSNPIEWSKTTDSTGYRGVGLMYPSDYAYAVGGNVRTSCLAEDLYRYDESSCYNNDWLYMSSRHQWLLSQYTSSSAAWYVFTTGYVNPYCQTDFVFPVHPTVYLNSNIKLGEGNGTQGEPYHLVA